MAAIGKVSAVFSASTGGLTVGVNRAKSSFQSMERSINSLRGSMRTLVAVNVGQLFASIANTVASYSRSLIQLGEAQAQVVERAAKLADRLGMTFGEFAGLTLAGERAGVSMDDMGEAATRAEIAFANAAAGSTSAIAAFTALGLSVQELAGMSAGERFEAISAAIAALPTEAQRAAAAVRIFGRAGAELLPLFNAGADAIAEARAEAERLGLALTSAQANDIKGMNDALSMAYKAIEGIVRQVVAYMAPAIKAAADNFRAMVAAAGGGNIGAAIGKALIDGAIAIARVVDQIIPPLKAVFDYFTGASQQMNGTASLLLQVGAVFKAVFAGAAVLFLGVLRLGITPLLTIVQNLATLISHLPGTAGDVARTVIAGSQGLLDGLDASIGQWAESAMNSLDFATDPNAAAQAGGAWGEGAAGPLEQWLLDARAQADADRARVDEAAKRPIDVNQNVNLEGLDRALQAVDSRSKEGVAEMFRIMRGNKQNIEEEQLEVQREIAKNTKDMGVNLYETDIATS